MIYLVLKLNFLVSVFLYNKKNPQVTFLWLKNFRPSPFLLLLPLFSTLLTPFQQAKRYAAELPYSSRPRWIVTCNFEEFLIYDMEKPSGEPEEILLKDLKKEYYRLQFLVDTGNQNIQKEMEVSFQAGRLVGSLYDALLKQYIHPENEESLKSLNILLQEACINHLLEQKNSYIIKKGIVFG